MNSRFAKKPKCIKVKHFDTYIKIIIPEMRVHYFVTLLGTVAFSFFLFHFYFCFFKVFDIKINKVEDLHPALLVVFLAIIVLFYYIIAMWINRIYIIANNQKIKVCRKPFPTPGIYDKIELDVANLKRLYSKLIEIDTYENSPPQQIGFDIRAATYDGADKKLLMVGKKKAALFIESTLEDYLNMKDGTSGSIFVD